MNVASIFWDPNKCGNYPNPNECSKYPNPNKCSTQYPNLDRC